MTINERAPRAANESSEQPNLAGCPGAEETVSEFLARGGIIQVCPTCEAWGADGLGGLDHLRRAWLAKGFGASGHKHAGTARGFAANPPKGAR